MTETLLVGDLHLKGSRVLPRVDALLEARPQIVRVVLLGDYMDDWGARYGDFERECRALLEWHRHAADKVAVDVLVGNHDLQYLAGLSGPGTCEAARAVAKGTLLALEPVVATVVGGCLVTHGGLMEAWAEELLDCVKGGAVGVDSIAAELNAMFEAGDYAALDMTGPGRGGCQLPSPLWADIFELETGAMPSIDQVVGHTPAESVFGFKTEAGTTVFDCDTFSTMTDGEPIGDGSVLVYREGGGFRSFELPE